MLSEILQAILYSDVGGSFNNAVLFGFRLLLGYQMICVHGLKKLTNGSVEFEAVPNPLLLPPRLNQGLATFSDVVAPMFVVLGLATRLMVLPILAVTLTGYFVIHRRDALAIKDIPFMYSLSFLFLFLVGAGRFSVDSYIYDFLYHP